MCGWLVCIVSNLERVRKCCANVMQKAIAEHAQTAHTVQHGTTSGEYAFCSAFAMSGVLLRLSFSLSQDALVS